MSDSALFKVTFLCRDSIYEVYARQICESSMFGFIEIEEFVFGSTTQVVVDPSEERLKQEFSNIKRSYIPAHAILRIDEVKKEGVGKVIDKGKSSNISHLPSFNYNQRSDDK